jgi:ankyrin repeat protein
MRPSAQDKDYIAASKEMDRLPALLSAACEGSFEQLSSAVAEASERGQSIDDLRTSGGMTALMLACRKGPSSKGRGEGVEDKVRMLLEKGAEVNLKSTAGCVALAFAAEAGNPRVVSMLIQRGAEVKALSPDGTTSLMLACQNGWTQAAEMLLDAGADVRQQGGSDDFPPIIFAAMNGHIACVDMLIRREANVNYAKGDGFNALILAAGFNQLEVVRRLVRAGARIEDANAKGYTALLYACLMGQGPVVRALLQLGAHPLCVDKEGHSALHLASKGGHSDVVSALLQGLKNQRDFDINATTPKGDSALHLACLNGNEKVVSLLVNYEKDKGEGRGADQRMRDSSGRDAFAIAKEGGHAPVCVLLQPIREQKITTYTTLNIADAFMRARDSLTVENVKALKRELTGVGVIDGDVLSTRPAGCDGVPSFFARLSIGLESQPELHEENEAMWQESKLEGKPFLLATWKPSLARLEPPSHIVSFGGGANAGADVSTAAALPPKLGKLGCVALPARHRFLLLHNDLTWHKFNVLVLGKRGTHHELNQAVKLIEDMRDEALAFAARSNWSKSIGLYFEPYPHASANALYLHIWDETDPKTGAHVAPPEELAKQLLKLEDVLSVLRVEREVEGAAWRDHSLKEDWSVRVVCISPIARNRGNLTLACMREVYSRYPSVVNSLLVVYDDRDQVCDRANPTSP